MTKARAERLPKTQPTPPERRGFCPTLARPMQTGDGLLARLRPIDNALTLPQVGALAEAAAQFGNGILEITARGSLQVRGLRPETVAPFEKAVLATGIPISTGVGIESPPLAGLDPDELVDVRPLATESRRRIAAHVPPLVLAPKLAITIDGGGRFHLGDVAADVKVTALRDGEQVRFLLAVGGVSRNPNTAAASQRGVATRAVAVLDADQVVNSIVGTLEKLAALGPSARGKDLVLPWIEAPSLDCDTPPLVGIHPVCSISLSPATPPSALPGISPSRGENGCGALAASQQRSERAANSSDAWGDEPTTCHSPPLRGRWPAGQRGVIPGANASDDVVLGLALAHSQVDSASLIALANAAESLGALDIRLAPDHGFFITGLNRETAEKLRETAASIGLLTNPDDSRRSIALCAGSRGCASAFFDTRVLAEKLLSHAPDLLDGSFDLHLSGCAKGCAHPAAAFITIVGARAGYGLVVNGAASAEPLIYVAENDIDTALQRLQALLRQSKEDGESSLACLERLGAGAIAAALQLDRT
jgi:precorrin-3B synthase